MKEVSASMIQGVQDTGHPRYRFGFILNTTIGNMTRYVNLRKYAERDSSIEFAWGPVTHHLPKSTSNLTRWVPEGVRLRLFVLGQALPILRQLGRLDAVMVHLFEADMLLALHRCWRQRPVFVSSTDEAPMVDRKNYPLYPNDLTKPVWRQRLRLAIDLWRVRHTDLFIPFSAWAADILTSGCGARTSTVHPIHVGLDLELWPSIARTADSGRGRLKLLFVGGDFARKGGAMLLDVFERRFNDIAELHLVSKQVPPDLPSHVYAYRDMVPNDLRLRDLYAACDVLVVPTTADTGPLWVFLEAMASGMPIIGTDTGSNKELVRHGNTGHLIPVGDSDALSAAIAALASDAALRLRMGRAGRALVERKYDAAINVPRILELMKAAVNYRRALGLVS